MSASLVGSEMCIRDSSITPQGVCRSASAIKFSLVDFVSSICSIIAVNCSCLLYTSDAADDM
eukprot:5239470-Alexandrium_andersonii.AAC.1